MRFSPLLFSSLLMLPESSHGFQVLSVQTTATNAPRARSRLSLAYTLRDDDMTESLVGGIRYEMVPLPDSMMDTTLFVGNLCEFCKDEDLSNLFCSVSTLQSVPACVARKPNMSSLRYGFVTFLNAQEKEVSVMYERKNECMHACMHAGIMNHLHLFMVLFTPCFPCLSRLTTTIYYSYYQAAIMRFHGKELMGRRIKVEPIIDHAKTGRVKVPDRLVNYVVGSAKTTISRKYANPKTKTNSISSLRSIARLKNNKNDASTSTKKKKDTTKDPVPALKRKQLQEPTKEQLQSQLKFPLTILEQAELLRAARRGYLVLEGRTQSRARSSNALASSHRQYCDEREQPQIILCKAAGREGNQSPLDCLIVDLSPLRLTKAVGDDWLDDFIIKWKTQILAAAANAEMELRRDYQEDNCRSLSIMEDDELGEECQFEDMDEGITEQIARSNNNDNSRSSEMKLEPFTMESSTLEYTITLTDDDSWSTEPISRLPVVSVGVFEGERSNAKAMAKELAGVWGIPSEPLDDYVQIESSSTTLSGDDRKVDGNKRRGNKARRARRNENKRQRRNNQRDLDMYWR
jgi:hypothetical protein